MKLKIERSHQLGLLQGCASFRFQVVSLPGFYAAKKPLKKIKIDTYFSTLDTGTQSYVYAISSSL